MAITAYPAHVQAFAIVAIDALEGRTGSRTLRLSNGTTFTVSVAQLTTRNPQVGDYLVVPSEGNPYIAAKSTFAVTYG